MKKSLLVLFILLVSMSVQAQTYYYSGGRQLELSLDETQIVVRLYDENTLQSTQQTITNISNSLQISCLQNFGNKMLIISNINQNAAVFLQNLQGSLTTDAEFVCFAYKLGNLPWYPINEIILELQPNVAISSVLQMFSGEVILARTLQYDTYILKVNQISRLFDIANQIYTSGLVKYAHPDFIAPITLNNSYNNPSDPTNLPSLCSNSSKLYNISPNPASEQIKIGVSEKTTTVECPILPPQIKSMIDSKEGITFSEVNIYNSFGALVLSAQTNKAKEFVIPLKTLKAGLYLVQISEGNLTEGHQIIVE